MACLKNAPVAFSFKGETEEQARLEDAGAAGREDAGGFVGSNTNREFKIEANEANDPNYLCGLSPTGEDPGMDQNQAYVKHEKHHPEERTTAWTYRRVAVRTYSLLLS